MKLLAIDGHDGAGKSTLATALAERVGGEYVRPFAGARGAALIAAWRARQSNKVIQIGREALVAALAEASDAKPLILDRGWLTVATLVPQSDFSAEWTLWLPTALVWCDELTTRARLANRSQQDEEPDDWHEYFLAVYRERLALHPGTIVRTDLMSEESAVEELLKAYIITPEFSIE